MLSYDKQVNQPVQTKEEHIVHINIILLDLLD